MTMEAYLDYNATTPVDPHVFEAMKPYLMKEFGNASSVHQKGQAARHVVEMAREHIADYLGTEPGDIVFTSGGTEADNIAVKGALEYFHGKKNHLIVSTIEHHAILHPARYLEKKGIKVSYIPVDHRGLLNLDVLKEKVTEDTALVSIMHVNNEVGTIQPVEKISAIAHAKGALFHTDAVQSFGKLKIDLETVAPDLISVSSHKICGPKGVGALYIKKGVKLKPMTHGGHQEKNIRPGTENVAAIVGFGKAVELLNDDHEEEVSRAHHLRDRLYEGLKKSVHGLHLNGHESHRIYNTLSLSFDGLDGETLLMNMDLKNIYTSTGSACTAGSVELSHVLTAMGLDEKRARATIRFSVGRFTTKEEIDYALHEIPPIIERLRKNAANRAR